MGFFRRICNNLASNFLSQFTANFQTIRLGIPFLINMETNNQEEMATLSERLTKAERRLKILTCEIKDIRTRINILQQSNSVTSGVRRVISSTTTRPVDSAASSNIDSNSNPSKRTKRDFPVEEGYMVVYTDGACENNGRVGAKAGIGIWFADNHPCNVSKPVNGRATNNTAEIQACTEALKIANVNGIKKLCIKTDSQFVINSMTDWIHKWKRNSWKVSTGGEVKNKADFIVLDQHVQQLESVKWVYTAGHRGIKGNEEADKLAKLGALQYKS